LHISSGFRKEEKMISRYSIVLLVFLLLLAGCQKETQSNNPLRITLEVSGPVETTLWKSATATFTFHAQYNGENPAGIKPFYTFSQYEINYDQLLPPFSGGTSVYGEPGSSDTTKATLVVFPASYSEYIKKTPFTTGASIKFKGSDFEGRLIEIVGYFTLTVLPEETSEG